MFDNNPTLTSSAKFPADFRAVSEALELGRAFVASAQCGADAEARLLVILEELVANLVEHGDMAADSEIGLELAALGADIGVTLSDSGTPFDPRDAPPPAEQPPERGGGAGLALVLAWSHIIAYEQADGRNCLSLVIHEQC